MKLDVPMFLSLINMAMDKDKEEKIHAEWVSLLPMMASGLLKYMSFGQYFDQVTGKNIDLRPTEDIIRDIEETHRKAHEKG